MTAAIRPAHPRDTAALARLKLRTFRETFIEGFAIPYPPGELALFEEASYAPAVVATGAVAVVAALVLVLVGWLSARGSGRRITLQRVRESL